jgi:predicted ATPase
MTPERPLIERLALSGYKSIQRAEIDFSRLNVLIGANGAGKSNLVSFFSLLQAALDGKLDGYVGRNGGPNSLLYLGAKRTSEIATTITVVTAAGTGSFHQRFEFRAPDSLSYSTNHAARPPGVGRSDEMVIDGLCSIVKRDGPGHPGLLIYPSLKDHLAIYHLNDTSLASPIRTEVYVQDNARLRPDAGNLAALLFLYKNKRSLVYERIRSTVRKVVPSFDDFVLEPKRLNPNNILLNWKRQGSDYLLGPHQISDGSLRAMALITLFLQPKDDWPDLLIVDEPELGLHPYALALVAGLIRAASVQTQILVTTQSTAFLDHFSAGEIIVIEAVRGTSVFRRLDPGPLKDWLDEYSIGELWQKNVIGGGPMP